MNWLLNLFRPDFRPTRASIAARRAQLAAERQKAVRAHARRSEIDAELQSATTRLLMIEGRRG